MKCDCEDVPLGRLLYCTAQDLFNAGERMLKSSDVTLEQMHVLKELTVNDGMKQKDLGEKITKTPANMTRILDRLEGKGLLERRNCPDDRRAIRVHITPDGIRVCGQGRKLFEAFAAEIFSGVTEEEMAVSRCFFDKVQANVSKFNLKAEEK